MLYTALGPYEKKREPKDKKVLKLVVYFFRKIKESLATLRPFIVMY